MPLVKDELLIPGTVIVYDDTNGGVAIDYTPFYSRIADATEAIETSIAAIEKDVHRLRQLADPNDPDLVGYDNDLEEGVQGYGSGIRMSEPYGYIRTAMLYKSLVKESGNTVINPPASSPAEVTAYIASLRSWADELETNLKDLK